MTRRVRDNQMTRRNTREHTLTQHRSIWCVGGGRCGRASCKSRPCGCSRWLHAGHPPQSRASVSFPNGTVYVYVYLYICVYTSIHLWIYIYTEYTQGIRLKAEPASFFSRMVRCIYMYMYIYVCMHLNTYVYIYIFTLTTRRTSAWKPSQRVFFEWYGVYIYICIYMCVYIYIYICIYIYTLTTRRAFASRPSQRVFSNGTVYV